ncbi:hypothetical protein ACS0TY_006022 [Phlomoides rotata]
MPDPEKKYSLTRILNCIAKTSPTTAKRNKINKYKKIHVAVGSVANLNGEEEEEKRNFQAVNEEQFITLFRTSRNSIGITAEEK